MVRLFSRRRLAPNVLALFGFLLAFVAGSAIASSLAMTPRATIQKVTGDVLAALRANQDKLHNNPGEVAVLITRIVDPYFDYHLMAEEVLGIAWRRADSHQRERFTQVFHALLTLDYAAAFRQYSGQTIKLTGMHWNDAAHKRATVLSKIYHSGEQPVEVDYYLHATQGRWQIYDVMVDGISLLINYRETFVSELQRESLDILIAHLQQKVASDKRSKSP